MASSSVFLKKSKMQYTKDVAKIKPFELFGIDSCVTWSFLAKNHLILEVLNCGGLTCEEQKCLENELEKKCNC